MDLAALAPQSAAMAARIVAEKRLIDYLEATGETRARVRHSNPTLWRAYVDAQTTFDSALVSDCVLCGATNASGSHQLFNTLTLCLVCLSDAVTARTSIVADAET